MKNQNAWKKLGDFVLGKGFYIVLFLCVATIGISGYYLIRTLSGPAGSAELTGGTATVVLPDSEANGPDPVGTPPQVPEVQDQEDKTEEDDPQTVRPVPQEPAEQTVEPVDPTPPRQTAVVYTWPVKGEVLRDFSVETLSLDPTLGDWRTHGGLDIAAAAGTQVIAMRAGTVAEVYRDGLMGSTVIIDHGDGLSTTYCNLEEEPAVKPGEAVETGTVIGSVGSTAIAESGLVSHLHLEAWLDGERVDPREYLPK